MVYKTELAFMFPVAGVHTICMTATNKNGVLSEETCIQTNVLPPDPCFAQPCKNAGICRRIENDPADFVCTCFAAYISGKRCEITKARDYCDPNPCLRGKCYEFRRSFFCYCPSGYTGEFCDINVNDCTGKPCSEHGICMDGIQTYSCRCYSRFNGTHCENDRCPTAHAGDLTCQNDNPGCSSSNDCSKHGVCLDDYTCTCRIGYRTDQYCTTGVADVSSTGVVKFVPTLEERSSLTCYYTPVDSTPCKVTVLMTAPPGSSGSDLGVRFANISEDLTHRSVIGPVITSTQIAGMANAYSVDIAIQGDDKMTRGQKYFCLEVIDSASKSSAELCLEVVITASPFTVNSSQESNGKNRTHKFIDTTLLGNSRIVCTADTPCDQMLYTTYENGCKNVISPDVGVTILPAEFDGVDKCITQVTYQFTTPGEYYICFHATNILSDSQTRCFYIEVYSPISDPCKPSPCQHNGLCFYNGTNGYYCICDKYFNGTDCNSTTGIGSVTSCSVGHNICNNGTCISSPGNNYCACFAGYTGSSCATDIDECIHNPCHHDATCINTLGSYQCSCENGYTGVNCEYDIDECMTYPCKNNGTCRNIPGSFLCSCNGFNGEFCEHEVDECHHNPCKNNGSCLNTNGSFVCKCQIGFLGSICEVNFDEYMSSSKCANGGTSTIQNGQVICNCKPGFTGHSCEQKVDTCASRPCLHGGTCEGLPGSYNCYCTAGYMGQDCSQDYDECAFYSPCKHGSTCLNTPGSYSCACADGYIGQDCASKTNVILTSLVETTTKSATVSATCEDVPNFPCVSVPGYNMCSDEGIATTRCRKTCGKCGNPDSTSILG